MSTPPPPPPPPPASLDEVANGQRLLILAIVVNLAILPLRAAVAGEWLIVGPAAVVGVALAVVGLLRLANGLGYSAGTKALLLVFACIPLACVVMLAMVNGRATKALRAGGYKVGFFGATGKREAA